MSKETQTMLPESAEPVYQLWSDEGFGGWTDTDKATYCWWLDSKNPPRMRKLYTAPVAAQPGLTQQTLDDVMAGIPARDAEIEALRKEIDTLRAQQDADTVDAEQWISVNERLPEIHEWRAGSIAGISDAVLTIDEDDPGTMTVQHLRKGGQGDLTTLYWDHGDSPTHWRPAPPLPGINAARKEQA